MSRVQVPSLTPDERRPPALLRHLEQVAADLGHTTVWLDTNGTLVEAIAMYERSGYRHIGRYNDNPYAQVWFEKKL